MRISLLITNNSVLYYKTDLFLKPSSFDETFLDRLKLPLDVLDIDQKTQKFEIELDELLIEWYRLAIIETLKESSFDRDVLKDRLMNEKLMPLERFYDARCTISKFINNPDITAEIEFRH